MSDEFTSAPAPSGGIDLKEHQGKLLVVEPLGVENGIPTVHGPSDAIRANVYVITGPGESDDFVDTLLFPKVLQSQLRGQVGKKVVGRLGQGTAKPGQSAPWVLEAATADDLSKAQAWQSSRNGSQFASAGAPATTQGAQPPF